MNFVSTRGQTEAVSFSEAVAIGLAPDGGLYVPEELPDLSREFAEWGDYSFEEMAFAFFKHFATDIDSTVLWDLIKKSYEKFDCEERAPLKKLSDDLWVLELFHGPTLAFKDFALQLLGNLYELQIKKSGQPINVLGATSGDTGAAAIHGLIGKSGVNIFILYPDGRVAPLQERQMACTEANNVYPLAIEGSFDDTQRVLKEVFSNQEFRKRVNLSAVNSINLARVLAQCVYYIYAFWQLPQKIRGKVEFIVPTGNFGNVLAGWMAQQMGLPIQSFRVATNQNDILHRLFTTGKYQVHSVQSSLAPSMDIQVASNFERFLYYAESSDPARVREIMTTFKESGNYDFSDLDPRSFSSSRTDDEEIKKIIAKVYEEFSYVVDPHTACGMVDVLKGVRKPQVVLATAHPAKFPETIEECIGVASKHPSLEKLESREIFKHKVASTAEAVESFILKHI
ncbi:MAG: threonine synthase [Verrucomicrobia bacterium]|nr:threonine synthase [Verrucomicrobiota bacterium]MDA1067941.1 threonine synthase [Verrucomicrobiota bacterium]